MSTFTDADRLRHPVIGVAELLAGTATGSYQGGQADDVRSMRDWLSWRVEAGWHPSALGYASAYDDAVRALARAALALFEHECGAWVSAP